MANERYNFKYLPLVGKLPGKSMVEQTETAINELASVVYDNVGHVGNLANEVQAANTNASNALDKATEALETSGRVYIKLITAVDVNDYYDSELYYINNDGSTNIPVRDRGFLEVKTNDDKTACEQVFIADSTGTPYYRHGRITKQTLGEETTYVVTWSSWYQCATTAFVQAELQDYLPLTGGTLTGDVNGVTPPAGDNSTKIATTEFVNAKAGNYLPLSGGTLTGAVSCAVTPTNNNHITNKKYVDDKASALTIPITHITEMDSAAAHNAFYRGKDLTAYWNSGEMSKAIQAGTFDNIFPGDYVIKPITVNGKTYNVKWIVGDLDYHLGMGDIETTSHHVLMFAESAIFNARMNATDSTSGGFKGSEMFTTTLPKVSSAIKSAFGADHVLNHRELLSKSTSNNVASGAGAGWTGGSTDWEWTSTDASLFNEVMIYGTRILSSSLFDVGESNSQIAAFRMNHGLIAGKRTWNWTRAVAGAASFAASGSSGESGSSDASIAGGGVRPYFLAR